MLIVFFFFLFCLVYGLSTSVWTNVEDYNMAPLNQISNQNPFTALALMENRHDSYSSAMRNYFLFYFT